MRVSFLPLRHALARLFTLVALLGLPGLAVAQETGGVSGTVTRADDGSALSGVTVTVQGTGIVTVTNTRGQYTLPRVPSGSQTLIFRWLGYTPRYVEVTITPGGSAVANASLDPAPVQLSEIMVSGVSRAPDG